MLTTPPFSYPVQEVWISPDVAAILSLANGL